MVEKHELAFDRGIKERQTEPRTQLGIHSRVVIGYFFQAEDGIRVLVVTGFRRVLFRSFIRPIDYECGEKPWEGDYEYTVQGKSTSQSKENFEKDVKACEEAKMEILRLTNIAYASVRIQVRESRVGDEFGRDRKSVV